MDTRTIFFIGKPGCGKGTQAKLLSEKTGWPIFAAGDLFRAIAEKDTPVGRKTKQVNEQGLLEPSWFAAYLYLGSLFSIPEGQSALFDGFSRKAPEAQLIIDSLAWLGRPSTILDIRVSDEEVEKRLAKRREIEGRADDAVVDERLKEYREYTEPAIELLRKSGTLIEINGEQTPEAIAADINAALGIR